MKAYLDQLLSDIEFATANVSWPFAEAGECEVPDWKNNEEEEQMAVTRELEDWTGIRKYELPPAERLTDEEVRRLFDALTKMLDAHNCMFMIPFSVPVRVQYETLRENFDQTVKLKQWHQGFFALCKPETEHGECTLGQYCNCRFMNELLGEFREDGRTPEEQRAADLETGISYLQKKYGSDWMKYYPHHLDKAYDDENGSPYDYLQDYNGYYDDDEE